MIPGVPHADDVTGLLADTALRLYGQRSRNTCADLAGFEGLPLEVLFPEPDAVPQASVSTRWSAGGVLSEDIVFPSLHRPLVPAFRRRYETEYPETHTVYARRIRTAAASDRPRLLYLHGYMQPETVVEELALLVSMALWLDVEIVQLQPPYHGRRSPRGAALGGELYWTADLVRSFEALRQNLLDARTLLGWLLAEDARPVGVMGLSLGGALTAALTCLDERFAFSIPLIAHMDLAAMVEDAPVLAPMRRDLERFGWSLDRFRRFVERIGWYDLRPRIPADRIHLFAASDDHFFAPTLVEAMWRRWGKPDLHWYPSSHMGFLLHVPAVMREVRRIVDRHARAARRAA